jgi:hypothetical protein
MTRQLSPPRTGKKYNDFQRRLAHDVASGRSEVMPTRIAANLNAQPPSRFAVVNCPPYVDWPRQS